MITPDTSVVVAAFASWHERHDEAREVIRDAGGLIGHVAVETFSVLTRMPPAQRAPAALVFQFLGHHFPEPKLALSRAGYDDLLGLALERGISGGAIYDALVAFTARQAKATLLTLDERAALTYQVVGTDFRLIR